MDIYVVDAHALIWFFTEDGRLSETAGQILEQAQAAVVQVLIPTIALAELIYIAQKKKFEVTIEEILKRIERGDGFAIVPFDYEVFKAVLQLPAEWEIHDRIIAATALYYKSKLISGDLVLKDSVQIETLW
jgi:PIN domain nuclease of toxin-antitoxin system